MGGDGHEYGLRIIYLQIQILEKDSNFHSDACIITSSSILHSRTIEYLKVFWDFNCFSFFSFSFEQALDSMAQLKETNSKIKRARSINKTLVEAR